MHCQKQCFHPGAAFFRSSGQEEHLSPMFSAVIKCQDKAQLILPRLEYLSISSTQQCPSRRRSNSLSGSLNSKNKQTVAWGWGEAKECSIPVSLQIYHLSWEPQVASFVATKDMIECPDWGQLCRAVDY